LKYRNPEGRSTSLYIRREHEETVRAAVEAWIEMWQAMLELSRANREALAQRVRRKSRG